MIKQLSYISIVIYFIILSSLNTVNTKSITIFSENDFRKALNSDYSNIIFKSSISIEGNYTLNSSIDKINITGISKDVILKFKNDIDGLYINDCNIVNIYNLTLVGNLFISDSFNITISDVNINGLIQTSSSNVFLNKVTYNNNQSQKSQYGIIQNKGFLTIYNSYFYGSSSITENILYVTNDKKEEIENYENALLTIINSNFTGEYECGIIKASSYRLYIQYSNFERGFTYDNGAVLNSELSYVYIDDCFFEDNLSYNSGGVFYFDNNYYNHCYSSEFRNSTAYKDGGIVYISNLDVINSYFYNIIISNINQYTDSDSSGIIAW
ncbi:hypothetical protein BCR36DRAFT_297134 [Piromyces finnis]|uniref:Right handed beta helix domain-containing protein n=1 Tax=Piromyces finnis TaxID=1754191 RepID=A0A1Y1V3U3_9FUNG|nr:hypothetical protein BCR36DRAFT_297134 [Piromyces finnis]|eukprot:ORX46591.1 hypothetical protein BCR36DRAFT_297134 [Piromyces finnis]